MVKIAPDKSLPQTKNRGQRLTLTDKPEMRDVIAVCQTMPSPLAVQVAIFVGHLRCGFWGAWAGGWALILPASVMVALLAAAYVHLHGLPWLTAIIYGVSPAVIALILHSWWRLVRLGMEGFSSPACRK